MLNMDAEQTSDNADCKPEDNGGVCADMDTFADRPYAIAPSVDQRYNTIRQRFLPAAC